MTKKQKTRKEKALVRLEAQLKSGVKNIQVDTESKYEWDIKNALETSGYDRDAKYTRISETRINAEVKFSAHDIARINKEIGILQKRI